MVSEAKPSPYLSSSPCWLCPRVPTRWHHLVVYSSSASSPCWLLPRVSIYLSLNPDPSSCHYHPIRPSPARSLVQSHRSIYSPPRISSQPNHKKIWSDLRFVIRSWALNQISLQYSPLMLPLPHLTFQRPPNPSTPASFLLWYHTITPGVLHLLTLLSLDCHPPDQTTFSFFS